MFMSYTELFELNSRISDGMYHIHSWINDDEQIVFIVDNNRIEIDEDKVLSTLARKTSRKKIM